jgi:MFS family permease
MLFAFRGRATRNFLGLLVLMHFILFVDRVNLAAAATVMQKDLGLSNIALGIAFSAFNYAYAPFQLVGGWFADRFGARRTLTVCGAAWSITTIATGAVSGLGSLFAVRFALGMGEGATLPAATRALSNWTSLASRGTAIGITHAAGRVGAGAAAPIVAFLIIWFSWRFSFVALGPYRRFGRCCGGGISTRSRASIRASPTPSWPPYRPRILEGRLLTARCRGGALSPAWRP